ncbi:MAG TPA: oligosaccharide flippase family protein [Anaerolineales bacterium]|nr:oligosaccharide flippase family protein [Anaerolineales bacterium]
MFHAGLLLILPLALLWQVTLGGKTLLPVDTLAQFAPFANSDTRQTPQNGLLLDLVVENYLWQSFAVESLSHGQIPLWNPYIFAGMPFLAGGQASGVYPFRIIFHILPVEHAYGWFLLLHFWLAGLGAYALARHLLDKKPHSHLAALLVGMVYQVGQPLFISSVFPMIVAGATWLPWLILTCDWVIKRKPLLPEKPTRLPWLILGSGFIGLMLLAGHPEIWVYALLVAAIWSVWRTIGQHSQQLFTQPFQPISTLLFLAAMVGLGLTIGAIQLIPQIELQAQSFRTAGASLAEVRGWAYPIRHIIAFILPNFYGSPAQHAWFDLVARQYVTSNLNAYGQTVYTTEWGIKNYVEGAAFVGVLTLVLALFGIASDFRKKSNFPSWFLAFLALVFLAFAFGTPLYAVIYYLPGLSALHTPFRWVWPLSLILALLAGNGLLQLIHTVPKIRKRIASGLALAGVGVLLAWLGLLTNANLADRVFRALAKADYAFPTAQAFVSFLSPQLLWLVLLCFGGAWLIWTHNRWMGAGLVGLIALDLFLANVNFLPAQSASPLHQTPSEMAFLQAQPAPFRISTYTPNGDKPLNANLAWLFHLYDIRGYDSIIPRQYVTYMEALEPQGELIYNRISPLRNPASLDSPLLDVLGVRYILTAEKIDSPSYRLVFSDLLNVYENLDALPLAYTLPSGCSLPLHHFSEQVKTVDIRHTLLVEGQEAPATTADEACTPSAVQITSYGTQEVLTHVKAAGDSWLVLNDSYSLGWKAWSRPLGSSEGQEKPLTIYRVNQNFRAVQIPAGEYTVRWKYSPDSFKLGGFLTGVGVFTVLFLGMVWAWRAFYRADADTDSARRVARNSITLMVMNLLNRAIDLLFAMFYARVLGPASVGNYTTAIVLVGWFEIITNFGLNTYLTREASRDRENAPRYLGNTTSLRLILGGLLFPLFIGGIALYQGRSGQLGSETVWAVTLLAIGMLFSSISNGLGALFFAYERAEYPAAIATATTILKVALGAGTLLMGYGIVGLAGVSIATNIFTMLAMGWLVWRLFFRPRLHWEPQTQRLMLSESFPLMINHLLATLFFKIDVPLLRVLRPNGDVEVGRYGTAYKYLDALNIIPAFLTLSLFPLMSAQAREDKAALARTYQLALKLLVGTAIPVALLATVLAEPLVYVLGGSEYLPDGALALQWMAWSMPFGWINSVTQYVLIALGRQRSLTWAFAVAVTFNLVANLIFIPKYGFLAAAIITIFSEIVEGAVFQFFLYQSLGATSWLKIFGRLLGAAGILIGLTLLGSWVSPMLGIICGILGYATATLLLRVFEPNEQAVLGRVLPGPLKKLAKR